MELSLLCWQLPKESKIQISIHLNISLSFVKSILQNPRTDVNKLDRYGVNAFWIANFHNQIEVITTLIYVI